MKLFKKVLKNHALVVGIIFFFLTSVLTYPLIVSFKDLLPGIGDVYTYAWTIWWFMYSIVYLHQSPFWSNLQFFPLHVNISQDLSIIHGIVSLPITYIWGPIASYNYIIFFTCILTGIGFYFFIRLITKNNFLAIFGSYIFTFSYDRYVRALIGQLDIASTEWIGFSMFFLSQLFIYRKYSSRYVFGAALFLALNAYTEYRNFFYMMVFTGVFITVSLVTNYIFDKHNVRMTRLVGALESALQVFLYTCLGIFPIVILNFGKIGDVQYAPTYADFNASPLSFITLPCDVLLSRVLNFCYQSRIFEGRLVYLGVIPIVLMVIYLIKKRNEEEQKILYIFIFCFIFFIILSLGTLTPLYQTLFNYIPLFKVIRVSSRLVILAEISVSVLSALGLRHLMIIIQNKTIRHILLSVVVVGLFLETRLINIPYTNAKTANDSYQSVLEKPGNYAMLEIPFGFRGNIYETLGSHETGMSFYYQMKHHIPIIGGYMSMIDWNTWQVFKKDTLMQKLINCQEVVACEPINDEERGRFNTIYKVKYVTFLNRNYSAIRDYLSKEFELVNIYDSEGVTVYKNLHVSL